MSKFWKHITLAAFISAWFYKPLIKLYSYVEGNRLGGTELDE